MQQPKEFKNITNIPQKMSREEIKRGSLITEAYNHIPQHTTNKQAAEWMAAKTHGELLRIQNHTKPTSPTNKFMPQIETIKHNLHTVISPNGKKEPKKPFPDNIITLRNRISDVVALSLPLYDPTSLSASTLRQIEKDVTDLEMQALDYAAELQDSDKENLNPSASVKTQQSLDSFLGTSPSKETTTYRKKQYKRKNIDIENNSSIKNFFKVKTKKARHESSEIVPEPRNQQQAYPIIIIEDEDDVLTQNSNLEQTQTQPELSGSEKLAGFRLGLRHK
jgi:hypothetical protein